MADELLALAADLHRRAEPFALATVVRCEAPTSAKPGAKAIVRANGTLSGWVGGACAEPVVVREALGALRDGQPRLISLVGEGKPTRGRTEGVVQYPMTCHSGGTLEIYVEPYLPKPLLLLVGHGPVLEALELLGRSLDYAVTTIGANAIEDRLAEIPLTRRASVVVATHGDRDEDALAQAIASDAGYVSLVASRRRAAVVLARLAERGTPAEALGRLKSPAGLDIGAVDPGEIAVSILAEIIQHHRGDKTGAAEIGPQVSAATGSGAGPQSATATLGSHGAIVSGAGAGRQAAIEAVDPICGMSVEIAAATYRSEAAGRSVYFCCRHCQETFDRDPARYPAGVRA